MPNNRLGEVEVPESASILTQVSKVIPVDILSNVALSVTEKLSLVPGPVVAPPSKSKYPPPPEE